MSNPATLQKWPPPPAGNDRAVTHGGYSDRLVQPRARELADEVFAANAHLDRARDGAAVARYAVALARVERAYRWLAGQDDDVFADLHGGVVHACFAQVERWERACDRAEDKLGLNPTAAARLGVAKAAVFDLALAMAADAEAEARERGAACDG